MKKSKLPDLPIKPQNALIIGVALAIIAPTLLINPALCSYFDFSNTGEIGDTIGGITAPIINITAAILIYYSFKEQFNANQIQTSALKAERDDFKQEMKIDFILKLVDGPTISWLFRN